MKRGRTSEQIRMVIGIDVRTEHSEPAPYCKGNEAPGPYNEARAGGGMSAILDMVISPVRGFQPET